MFEFTDDERAHLNEMHAITTNSAGQELLVGLNEEETAFYMQYCREFAVGRRHREDSKRYLELHDKREKARFAVLGAEIELRNENPPRH